MANIGGLVEKYLKNPDERFFHDVFIGREYANVGTEKVKVVVDVGALAGEFSAYVYDQADIIYAIEPFNPYYIELESNIKEFELENIKPFNLALSDYDGMGFMTTSNPRGGNQFNTDNGQETVVKTLTTFMNDQNIDYIDILKIDIEGSEKEVFNIPNFPIDKIGLIIGEHLGSATSYLTQNGFEMLNYKNNIMLKRKIDGE